MTSTVLLRGISWNHSRAFPPLVASAQRFEETHPGVEIRWHKQSLHDFGHANVADLVRQFDLIILDHPWAGEVVANHLVLTLDDLVPLAFRNHLAHSSVGLSWNSYVFEGQLFALPVDAASQFASYREDILLAHEAVVPKTWTDVLVLARKGMVAIPGFHVDLLLSFLGMYASMGVLESEPDSLLADRYQGLTCLHQMRELACLVPAAAWNYQPTALYEEMARTHKWAYCPFGYGYSNFSRVGFAPHVIQFTNLISMPGGLPLRGTLGGAGIAISSRCYCVDIALEYAMSVAAAECQRNIYLQSGGQPAHAEAWNDDAANILTHNFFRNTFRSMREAWMRPRYAGYIYFQKNAGLILVEYLRNGGNEIRVLEEMERVYRKSKMLSRIHL